MPVNQALIYLVTAANAYSNIFLYRFLVNLTANNTAINETDKEVLKTRPVTGRCLRIADIVSFLMKERFLEDL